MLLGEVLRLLDYLDFRRRLYFPSEHNSLLFAHVSVLFLKAVARSHIPVFCSLKIAIYLFFQQSSSFFLKKEG